MVQLLESAKTRPESRLPSALTAYAFQMGRLRARVGDVQRLVVRARSEAIGPFQLSDDGRDLAVRATRKTPLNASSLPGSVNVPGRPKGGSVKYSAPLSSKTRSLGLLRRFPSKLVASGTIVPVGFAARNPAVAVLAQRQPALQIEGEAVRSGLLPVKGAAPV